MSKDLRFAKNSKKKSSWPIKTAWIFFIACALLLCIYLITPVIARYLIVNILEQEGMTQVNFVESRWQPWTPAIEIDQLDWKTPEGSKVSIKYAELTLDWSGIFSKHLNIKNLKIDQLILPVSLEPELNIGGFKLSSSGETSTTSETQQQESWHLSLTNLDILDTHFTVDGAPVPESLIKQPHKFGINTLNVQNFSTDDFEQKTQMDFKGYIDDLEFELATNAAPLSSTQSLEGSLNILPTGPFDQAQHWVVADLLKGVQGNGELGLKLEIDHKKTQEGRIINFNIDIQSPELESEIKRDVNVPVMVKVNDMDLQISSTIEIQKNRLKLSAQSKVLGSKLDLKSSNGLQFLLSDFNINTQLLDTRASLSALEQIQPNLDSDIQFSQAQLFQNNNSIFDAGNFKTHIRVRDRVIQLPELLLEKLNTFGQSQPFLDQLVIDNMSYGRNELGEQSLQVENISLDTINAQLELTPQGDLAVQQQIDQLIAQMNEILPAKEPTNTDTEITEETSTASAAHFKLEWLIQNFILKNKSQINLNNPEAKTYKSQILVINELQTKNLSMSQPSWFQIDAVLNDNGSIKGSGDFTLADVQANTDINLEIDNLVLPPLSGYIEPILGYTIKTGSLDSQIQIKSQAGEGDSFINVEVQKLEMDPADKNIIASLSKELTMPLDLSLSLLKNKNDIITLKIPINFNDEGIDTDITAVIQQALTRATKNASMTYLKLALQPYGSIIMLAEKSGELFNEMQLVNISFDPMSSTLGDGQIKPAEKLVSVLQRNETMSIRLCPTATEAESADWPSATTEEKQQALETLAQQRALSLKKYFQENQIKSKRLFVCAPEIKKKGQGEVKISL